MYVISGPAPEGVTDKIYEESKSLTSYKILNAKPVDISVIGECLYGDLEIEIVDSVKDYVVLMKELFDFEMIKSFLAKRKDFSIVFDGMNGGFFGQYVV